MDPQTHVEAEVGRAFLVDILHTAPVIKVVAYAGFYVGTDLSTYPVFRSDSRPDRKLRPPLLHATFDQLFHFSSCNCIEIKPFEFQHTVAHGNGHAHIVQPLFGHARFCLLDIGKLRRKIAISHSCLNAPPPIDAVSYRYSKFDRLTMFGLSSHLVGTRNILPRIAPRKLSVVVAYRFCRGQQDALGTIGSPYRTTISSADTEPRTSGFSSESSPVFFRLCPFAGLSRIRSGLRRAVGFRSSTAISPFSTFSFHPSIRRDGHLCSLTSIRTRDGNSLFRPFRFTFAGYKRGKKPARRHHRELQSVVFRLPTLKGMTGRLRPTTFTRLPCKLMGVGLLLLQQLPQAHSTDQNGSHRCGPPAPHRNRLCLLPLRGQGGNAPALHLRLHIVKKAFRRLCPAPIQYPGAQLVEPWFFHRQACF